MLCTNHVCFQKHQSLLLCEKKAMQLKKERKLVMRNPSSSKWCSCRVQAVKEKGDSESENYEVDAEKAREALQKLDQQLQSLSTKQVPSPKLRASEVKFREAERGDIKMREKEVEISGSFLGYTAVALVLFTIFYNFLFYFVIAPSIDNP